MKRYRSVFLFFIGIMLMTTPAFAADYNFETSAPKDYYVSTSYESFYGTQYNYGGRNAVDFLDPLAEGAPSISTGNTIEEYGINAGVKTSYPHITESNVLIRAKSSPELPGQKMISADQIKRADGSIGTLIIPTLGIRYKVYEGTDSAAMRKGVGHFPATGLWDGNIGLCGHNRGSNYNIGSIKKLDVGDAIRYETSLGIRTYKVKTVKIIDWDNWDFLSATEDNRITIITCLAGQPAKRVCVQAVEVK